MKIFLDTSSLFKLYHQEAGTAELEQVFAQGKISHVYLSDNHQSRVCLNRLEEGADERNNGRAS